MLYLLCRGDVRVDRCDEVESFDVAVGIFTYLQLAIAAFKRLAAQPFSLSPYFTLKIKLFEIKELGEFDLENMVPIMVEQCD